MQIKKIMDSVLLRKLSRKSILGFGKFSELTVQDVLNLNHTAVLRWYYYNASNITFMEDILREIHINPENEIQKPGTDKEMGKYIDKKMWAILISNDRSKAFSLNSKNNKDIKMNNYRKKMSRNYSETKGYLQAKNHGH